MKYTEGERIHHALRANGTYTTPEGGTARGLTKILGRWHAWYVLKLFRVVWSGFAFARRNAFDRKAWLEHSCMMLKVMEDCGGRFSISGVKHLIALSGPHVIAVNHMSIVETLVVPGICLAYRDVSVVVKDSLMRYPWFGRVLAQTHPIVVARRNPRDDLKLVLTRGEAMIRQGRHVLLFPQATRSADFDPKTFNTLGMKLARRAGVPVMPLAVKTDFQGIGKHIRDFGPVDRSKTLHFEFGEPLAVYGNGKETQRQVVQFIESRLRQWGTSIVGHKGGMNDTGSSV